MTNAELGEKVLNEMYSYIMSGMSAASAALDGKVGTGFTVWMGGVDGLKDLATHPNENHYEAIGRTIGNMINTVVTLGTATAFKSASVKTKAFIGGSTAQTLAEINH